MTRRRPPCAVTVQVAPMWFRVSAARSLRTSAYNRALTTRSGVVIMPDTLTDPATIEATAFIDDMLRLVAEVKSQKHRDPMRALQDRLLEIRSAG